MPIGAVLPHPIPAKAISSAQLPIEAGIALGNKIVLRLGGTF
jgi:hypothetical protein